MTSPQPQWKTQSKSTNDASLSSSGSFFESDDEIGTINTDLSSTNSLSSSKIRRSNNLNPKSPSNINQKKKTQFTLYLQNLLRHNSSNIARSECSPITNAQSNITQDLVNQPSNIQDLANQSNYNQKSKPKLPPPIIVPASLCRKVVPKLMTITPAEVIEDKAFRNDSVKTQCYDAETFRIAQKYLRITETNLYYL